jgi:hypothetical protein
MVFLIYNSARQFEIDQIDFRKSRISFRLLFGISQYVSVFDEFGYVRKAKVFGIDIVMDDSLTVNFKHSLNHFKSNSASCLDVKFLRESCKYLG